MKSRIVSVAAIAGLTLASHAARADVVFNDTIFWLGGAPVGSLVTEDFSEPTTVSSLGFHLFTVTSSGQVVIDVLSFELSQFTGQAVDVNGDGESAFIDSVIYLFHDDGTPNGGVFIGPYNDDSLNLGTDGSVNGRDSRMVRNLAAGNYLLVIGAYDYGFDDINAGVNTGAGFGPYTWVNNQMRVADHGDYRLTITGNVVPTPGAAALIGLGGLALSRRRRAR
ncbi:MAG TPA: DVUA0089 family protein [Phycisphaerales bacterium]|nr:DVUA0089 family protein [Phycisphaerales bacterium]